MSNVETLGEPAQERAWDLKLLALALHMFVDINAEHVKDCEFEVIDGYINVDKDTAKVRDSKCWVLFRMSEHVATKHTGNLFGGIVGSIADIVTTVLMSSCEVKARRLFTTTLTTNLNIEFLGVAKMGDEVIIEVSMNKFGSTVGFTSADFYKVEGTKRSLLYRVNHHKIFAKGPDNRLIPAGIQKLLLEQAKL
mmetsp:Transcript_7690/g.12452  ORF Transcript_7690/g.12452 Transcript_7690/m.12452 type:complete len:194 (-) Transcript_7690:37-618(-)